MTAFGLWVAWGMYLGAAAPAQPAHDAEPGVADACLTEACNGNNAPSRELALSHVGPLLDPIADACVGPAEHALLPSGRHLGALGDLWFIDIVNMQSGGGGIELFDALRHSAHGFSSRQMRVRLGALDITDPARPGEPLLDVPDAAWERLALNTLWTDQPGFTWDVLPAPDASTDVRVIAGGGGAVGGGVWVPPHLFDRDPAFAYGAPTQRRALRNALEGAAVATWQSPVGPLRIGVEGLRHDHRYLTLDRADLAERQTAWLTGVVRWHLPWRLTAVWQGRERAYHGAQYRWPAALTSRQTAQAWLGQLGTTLNLAPGWALQLDAGGSYRNDREAPNSQEPATIDVSDQWLWQARPKWGGMLSRWRGDGAAALTWTPAPGRQWALRGHGGVASWMRRPYIPGGRTDITAAGVPTAHVWWNTPAPHGATWRGWRGDIVWEQQASPDGMPWLAACVGLDISSVSSPGGPTVGGAAPAVGLAARGRIGAFEWFGLARREPELITAEVADFIDPGQPSGVLRVWGGGPTVHQIGAATHGVHDTLRRPSSNHVAVGFKSPRLGPMQIIFQGVGRWLFDRYTVVGEGAHYTAAGPVYAQDPPTLGHERFVLTNAQDVAYHLGIEANVVSVQTTRWFVNVGGAAYVSPGSAPLGSFPDRNDPGAIDEASATPDDAIHAFGRYDQDRSFTVKLLAGVMPWEGLSVAVAARYRDGEPFTRIALATGLPQGPTPWMAVARGDVRHTFHMTWDVRMRYALAVRPFSVVAQVDIFNLWGSATELLEDSRTGPTFRRALEAVPGRAIFGSLQLGWNGNQ